MARIVSNLRVLCIGCYDKRSKPEYGPVQELTAVAW
jgi:hypothetical protein